MTEQHNELAELWQAQPVTAIDVAQIRRDYRRQRVKQRCYMVLDILGVVPVLLLAWFKWDALSSAAATMIVVLGSILLPLLGYLLWLRRIAAFGSNVSTTDYLARLTQQMHNNARIAWLTKHSSWLTPLFITAFYAVMYLRQELPESKYVLVASFIGLMGLIMPGIFWWASRRQARFSQQARALTELGRQL